LASLAEPVSAPSAESIALADLELSDAWKRLSPKEQELLALWAFENLGVREISKVLSITENASNIRLTRAKQKLISLLSENN
jgi:RNA polymerase sigma-70 factor (ECF subfamily)